MAKNGVTVVMPDFIKGLITSEKVIPTQSQQHGNSLNLNVFTVAHTAALSTEFRLSLSLCSELLSTLPDSYKYCRRGSLECFTKI